MNPVVVAIVVAWALLFFGIWAWMEHECRRGARDNAELERKLAIIDAHRPHIRRSPPFRVVSDIASYVETQRRAEEWQQMNDTFCDLVEPIIAERQAETARVIADELARRSHIEGPTA